MGGGKFIVNLSKGFIDDFEVYVLAPHFHGAKMEEKLYGFNIRRFRQNPFKYANLSYRGSGILPALKKQISIFLNSFLFDFTVICSKKNSC